MKQNKIIKKILIMGDAGRGKTTFAENLSQLLGIKKYSTDDFFWEVKYTQPRGEDKDIQMVQEIYRNNDEWIIGGTTRRMIKIGLEDADIIFYLTFRSTIKQIWVLYKRYRSDKEETLKGFYKLVTYQYKKRKRLGKFKHEETFEELLNPFEAKVVRLESFREIDGYLRVLGEIIDDDKQKES